MATLPFVIFAFLRIFVRENRLVDETFIVRARKELEETRLRCDALTHQVDRLEKSLHAAHRREERLEEELVALRMRFDLSQRDIRTDEDEAG
jgi:predicted  nucleic acid-binding Zn-ribbon protein